MQIPVKSYLLVKIFLYPVTNIPSHTLSVSHERLPRLSNTTSCHYLYYVKTLNIIATILNAEGVGSGCCQRGWCFLSEIDIQRLVGTHVLASRFYIVLFELVLRFVHLIRTRIKRGSGSLIDQRHPSAISFRYPQIFLWCLELCELKTNMV